MFDTTTDLLPHQIDAVAKLLPSRINALFAEMGTGKSRIIIELAKLRQAKIDRVVWFCPVSLRSTVVAEILKHTDCCDDDIHVVDERTTERSIPTDRQWYVVGIESMGQSDRVVLAMRQILDERTFALVDESTYVKNNRAKRTQRITHMSQRCRYRAVLTGTPFTAGIPDLYSQMYFLSPKILGYRSWYSFAANHITYDTRKNAWGRRVNTGRILRTHDHDYLARRMAPYTYQIRKDECLDLPPKLYETRHVPMGNEQAALYAEAKDFIYERYKNDDDPGAGLLRLFGILQCIAHGFWNRPILDDDGNETGETELVTVRTQRADALIDITRNLAPDEKAVVWAPYHRTIDEIVEALTAEYGADAVQRYDGTLSPRERDAQLATWRRSGRFLAATQSSGGHGLTLVEAHHSIFYGNGFKYGERAQAEDRIHRIGQVHKSVYVDIVVDCWIDQRVHEALTNRAGALQRFKEQVDEYRKTGLREHLRDIIEAM